MKEIKAGIINVLSTTGGDHILDDTTNNIWGITAEGETSSDDPVELVFGRYFDYGKVVSMNWEASQAEVRQIAVFGAEETETIVKSTRYAVQIGNSSEKYEGGSRGADIYAYTSPAVLSGTAQTDRANVYQTLINKINARNNFVTAYRLVKCAYTGGTSTGDAADDFIVGETVTQETSSVTAKVAKNVISSGAMADDDAAGNLYLYDISDFSSLLETAKTWTGAGTVAGVSTNIVVTQTNASVVTDVGMVILDDADYFISSVNRGGASEVYAVDGFDDDAWEIGRAAKYSRGIGSYMAKLAPVMSRGKEDVINMYGDYMLSMNDDINTALTYRTYTLTMQDDHKDVNGVNHTVYHTYVLFVSELNTGSQLTEFDTALDNVIAK